MNIQIHGWDGAGWFSHAITGGPAAGQTAAILRKLRNAPGAFHGKLGEFLTTAHDLKDSGLAVVHPAGLPGGPLGALTVVPANRRSRLRGDFAFGFVAHLSFFDGLIGPEAELAIHDYMENALRTEPASTHVFIVETSHPFADAGMALSAYLENLSMAMLHWLCEKDRECVRAPKRRPRFHTGSRAA